jgi:hypothetical protein
MLESYNSSNSLLGSELFSLSVEQLESLVRNHPKADTEEVKSILQPQAFDEKSYDRQRKAKQRASEREIFIPAPKNIELRMRCLNDFELLLNTYFPDVYDEAFTEDRSDMLRSIVHAAMYGGDQAIAGSRGEGKTTLAIDGSMCLMLKRLSSFPVVIGKNQDSASDELKALREKMVASERFIEDFPEIGVPMELAGPGVASPKQTVQGKLVRLYMGRKYFAFPTITIDQLPHWPRDVEPVSRGQIMGSLGINGKIRGEKFRAKRPTLAVIDDIEDALSASSDLLIGKNEKKIEEDIGGLGRSAKRIARVMLCTIQNRKCIAYKYTDPKQKPSWNGKRYRKMRKEPDRVDLVQQYIEMRQLRRADDPDAREAFCFWRDNQDVIERGCDISNRQSYNKSNHADGEAIELSAIQAYYNRVADMGRDAVATEIDNDPPETVGPQGNGLTADLVSSRLSGLSRFQIPVNAEIITAGIDIGKYNCHWTVCAWWRGAGGVVIDYGVAEVVGNENVRLANRSDDMEASEPAIYRTLLAWRDYLLNTEYVDAAGQRRQVNMVLCDSGTYSNAVYEFCRQVKGVFRPSKGIAGYRPKNKDTANCVAGANQHAQWLQAQGLWLQELDTDYWKQWVHERFLTPTFDENNLLRRGALSLYQPAGNKRHVSYSQHIVAEELTTEFKEGKGTITKWVPRNQNNHWLDATYLAAACTEAMGIQLITPSEVPIEPVQPKPKTAATQSQPRTSHGKPNLKQRKGGWIRGMRNR